MDTRALGERVRDRVAESNAELEDVMTLPAFLAAVDARPGLKLADQIGIVDQVRRMFQEIYVNLQLKRAMHAIDPVQRLRLLERRLSVLKDPIPDRKFHHEMLSIFTSLRDYHTLYLLPEPYRSFRAFLPFEIEEYFEDQEGKTCRYFVRVVYDIEAPGFERGATLLYWNGVPIERAVELNAERTSGSNPDARHSRGVETMTLRSMAVSLPPDEEWVDIVYLAEGEQRSVRAPWLVFRPMSEPAGEGRATARGGVSGDTAAFAPSIGIDMEGEQIRNARVTLFSSKDLVQQRKAISNFSTADEIYRSAPTAGLDLNTMSIMPDRIMFGTKKGFGYIRIFSFSPPRNVSVGEFVAEVTRIVSLMPETGLILDVRGNPGGVIMAGERLLQLFTPRPIETERLQFVNTPATLELSRKFEDTLDWAPSIAQAVETGAAFSQAFPIESFENSNAIGQRYQGPVVLITDARCYSTTDIFAAGFEDNRIGKILGVSGNTGAGGANVWNFGKDLVPNLPDLFEPLPLGIEMTVGVRRTLRAGDQSGVPLEDLGVKPTKRHFLTRKDVLGKNEDMMTAAIKLLKQASRHRVNAKVEAGEDGVTVLRFSAENVDRVDISLNGRPCLTCDVNGSPEPVRLPDFPRPLQAVHLRGFHKEQLVASCLASLR